MWAGITYKLAGAERKVPSVIPLNDLLRSHSATPTGTAPPAPKQPAWRWPRTRRQSPHRDLRAAALTAARGTDELERTKSLAEVGHQEAAAISSPMSRPALWRTHKSRTDSVRRADQAKSAQVQRRARFARSARNASQAIHPPLPRRNDTGGA